MAKTTLTTRKERVLPVNRYHKSDTIPNLAIDINKTSMADMIRKISAYDEVHTDRAHVAISASQLGKQTVVYDCGYFKVRAIYNYSLRDLPNTRFHNNQASKVSRPKRYLDKLRSTITLSKRAGIL